MKFYAQGINQCPLLGIECRHDEGVAADAHFLISADIFLNPVKASFGRIDAIGFGGAVADGRLLLSVHLQARE